MDDLDPKFFYTGLVASVFSALKAVTPDAEPYARFIGLSGEPALELGCGEGDVLIELRRRGLDVDGLDSSPDMLERCRARAADAGVDVTLYDQPIEEMDIPRRYRSIFLAGATFNLLPTDELAEHALSRMRAHLEGGGLCLVPLMLPDPISESELGVPREAVSGDTTMRVRTLSQDWNAEARLHTVVLRYELSSGEKHTVVERPWILHWHSQEQFAVLAAKAGFTVAAVLDGTGEPAPADAKEFGVVLAGAT